MRSFQRKRGWGGIFESKPVLVLLAIFILIFAWSVIGFFIKMERTMENKKIAENQVSELEKKKEKLSSDIAKLKTTEGVEESIREKFGLAKEGEELIIIVEDQNSSEIKEESSGGFFDFFKNLFK